MNEYLPLIDSSGDKRPKLDYRAANRYWLISLPILLGPFYLFPWPYKPVGLCTIWLLSTVWIVMRTIRRQLGPALLKGKVGANHWIIGLDFWSMDMAISISLFMLVAFLGYRFHLESSILTYLSLLLRIFLIPLVAIPFLSRWGVPHKPTPSLSDWDREFIA